MIIIRPVMRELFLKIIKTDARVMVCIGLFVMAGYSFTLASPFKTLDDDLAIVMNEDIRDLKNIPAFFQSAYFKAEKNYYRPLVYVTYALEYRFFGLDPVSYNRDNILLHVLNAFLVFQIALFLMGDRRLAFAAAFLFAIHPIHWATVGNITNRATLLYAFFGLSGFLLFLNFIRERRFIFLAGAAACYVFALVSKESAAVLILVLAAYLLLFGKRSWRTAGFLLPFVFIDLIYLCVRHALEIKGLVYWPSLKAMALGVVSAFHGILVYVKLLVCPWGLYFDRTQEVYQSWGRPEVLLTLVSVAGAVYLFQQTYRRISTLGIFLVCWFFIELLPVSGLVTVIVIYPGGISLAEHLMYVACVPACILMVKGAEGILGLAQARKPALAGVARSFFAAFLISIFLVLLWQGTRAADEALMLRDALEKNPRNARLQSAKGMFYVKAKDLDMAIRHFRSAVAVDPSEPKYRIALGAALANKGDHFEAARQYEAAHPTGEHQALLEKNKRAVYQALVLEYENKLAWKQDAQDLFLLGWSYFKLGDLERAALNLDKAWTVDHNRRDALISLDLVCQALLKEGRSVEACHRLAERRSSL